MVVDLCQYICVFIFACSDMYRQNLVDIPHVRSQDGHVQMAQTIREQVKAIKARWRMTPTSTSAWICSSSASRIFEFFIWVILTGYDTAVNDMGVVLVWLDFSSLSSANGYQLAAWMGPTLYKCICMYFSFCFVPLLCLLLVGGNSWMDHMLASRPTVI